MGTQIKVIQTHIIVNMEALLSTIELTMKKENLNFSSPSPAQQEQGYINILTNVFSMESEGREADATQPFRETHTVKRPRPVEDYAISFSQQDLTHVATPHEDTLLLLLKA